MDKSSFSSCCVHFQTFNVLEKRGVAYFFHDTPYFYSLKRNDWILNTKFVLDERESA